MTQDLTLARNELFSAMDSEKPHAAYIKTILGQVAVTVWDNFLNKPVDVILKGDPKRKDAESIVAVYSERENAFFKRSNLRHFKKGLIIPYTVPENKVEEKQVEQSTDEELKAIIGSKFMALQAKLNQIDSVPVLYRMISLAEEMDKSEKITNAMKKRISELQVAEFPSQMEVQLNVKEEA